jgi:hypothetical protein
VRQGAISLRTIAIGLSWLVLAGLVIVTLVPIEFRPHSGLSAQAERFIAFAIAGCCLALAYPRRLWLAILLLALFAAGLEAAQFLAANRHPGLRDIAAKLLGGAAGLVLGWGLRAVVRALRGGPDAE